MPASASVAEGLNDSSPQTIHFRAWSSHFPRSDFTQSSIFIFGIVGCGSFGWMSSSIHGSRNVPRTRAIPVTTRVGCVSVMRPPPAAGFAALGAS